MRFMCLRRSRPALRLRQGSPARAALGVCIADDVHICDAIPEVKAAVRRFVDTLTNAGHRVERPPSPIRLRACSPYSGQPWPTRPAGR
jgi:hypothetical protein